MAYSDDRIISTKIIRPRLPSRRVARGRLARVLADSLKRPLTVVSAPAGYGKSTFLAEGSSLMLYLMPAAFTLLPLAILSGIGRDLKK